MCGFFDLILWLEASGRWAAGGVDQGQGRIGKDLAGQNRHWQVRAGQGRSGQVRTGQDRKHIK